MTNRSRSSLCLKRHRVKDVSAFVVAAVDDVLAFVVAAVDDVSAFKVIAMVDLSAFEVTAIVDLSAFEVGDAAFVHGGQCLFDYYGYI